MDGNKGKVLYVVRTWVPEDQLENWDLWMTNVHIPEVLAQPQVRGARKYRVASENHPAEWNPQVVTFYEFGSWADWESYNTSTEAAHLRKDAADHFPAAKQSRQVLVEPADFPKAQG